MTGRSSFVNADGYLFPFAATATHLKCSPYNQPYPVRLTVVSQSLSNFGATCTLTVAMFVTYVFVYNMPHKGSLRDLKHTNYADRDVKRELDLPVIGSLVHCESSALDRAATEARFMMFLVLTPSGEISLNPIVRISEPWLLPCKRVVCPSPEQPTRHVEQQTAQDPRRPKRPAPRVLIVFMIESERGV
uniref:Uncharacterized protein n=1 Tax=Timema genevievae TaxID=629358 RepID=A0A7R9K7J6_TIMGE|nr:unnamed protein product [Timema genevievae]